MADKLGALQRSSKSLSVPDADFARGDPGS